MTKHRKYEQFKTKNKKLALKDFRKIVLSAPIAAIDLLIQYKKKFLLGLRKNEPAKNFWFVPGGRIRKNEFLQHAFRRILLSETGFFIKTKRPRLHLIGEHFYKNSFISPKISTHYITLSYKVRIKKQLIPSLGQHRKWHWLTSKEILSHPRVHPFTKQYFRRKAE